MSPSNRYSGSLAVAELARRLAVLRGHVRLHPGRLDRLLPAFVSALRCRLRNSRFFRSGQRGEQLRPLVGDAAAPQVEHLQPLQDAGLDDLLRPLVAEVGQPQPQVGQAHQVRRPADRPQVRQPDVAPRPPRRRTPSRAGGTGACVRFVERLVRGQLLQRVTVAVVELQHRRFGIGRGKILLASTRWASRYSSSRCGICLTRWYASSPEVWQLKYSSSLPSSRRPLAEPEDADAGEVRAAAEGVQPGVVVGVDVGRHVRPRLVVRVDVLLRRADRGLGLDRLDHQLAEQPGSGALRQRAGLVHRQAVELEPAQPAAGEAVGDRRPLRLLPAASTGPAPRPR